MKLGFLKKRKFPRVADPKRDEPMLIGIELDPLEEHCVGELWDAIENKDIKAFRGAIEALVLNCFDSDEGKDAR